MKLSDVFENLILARAQEVAPAARTGRPRALSDAQVTTILFKLLRTGCQWRELDCGSASFMAVYRRLQLWERKNVIEDAYKRALETYSKLRPPKRHLMDSSHVRNRHGRRARVPRRDVRVLGHDVRQQVGHEVVVRLELVPHHAVRRQVVLQQAPHQRVVAVRRHGGGSGGCAEPASQRDRPARESDAPPRAQGGFWAAVWEKGGGANVPHPGADAAGEGEVGLEEKPRLETGAAAHPPAEVVLVQEGQTERPVLLRPGQGGGGVGRPVQARGGGGGLLRHPGAGPHRHVRGHQKGAPCHGSEVAPRPEPEQHAGGDAHVPEDPEGIRCADRQRAARAVRRGPGRRSPPPPRQQLRGRGGPFFLRRAAGARMQSQLLTKDESMHHATQAQKNGTAARCCGCRFCSEDEAAASTAPIFRNSPPLAALRVEAGGPLGPARLPGVLARHELRRDHVGEGGRGGEAEAAHVLVGGQRGHPADGVGEARRLREGLR
eukprot:scaffold5875_cov106-Isochrysis_galbana.AAC.1